MKGNDFKERWPEFVKKRRLKIGDDDWIYWANGIKILRKN